MKIHSVLDRVRLLVRRVLLPVAFTLFAAVVVAYFVALREVALLDLSHALPLRPTVVTAQPQTILVGHDAADVVRLLMAAGYVKTTDADPDTFSMSGDTVLVNPAASRRGMLEFALENGRVSGIQQGGRPVQSAQIEGEHLIALFDDGQDWLERAQTRQMRISQEELEESKVGIIAIKKEDGRYFDHHGVDGIALVGCVARDALLLVLRKGSGCGGGTISMQTIRSLVLQPPAHETTTQKVSRKTREIFLAAALEHLYTKSRILRLFLDTEDGHSVGITDHSSQ